MWNPKTSKTWSFGSYQGWSPPPNYSTQRELAIENAAPAAGAFCEREAKASEEPVTTAPFQQTFGIEPQPFPRLAAEYPAGCCPSPRTNFESSSLGASGCESPARFVANPPLPFAPQRDAPKLQYMAFPPQQGILQPPSLLLEPPDENTFPGMPSDSLRSSSVAAVSSLKRSNSAGSGVIGADFTGRGTDVFSFRQVLTQIHEPANSNTSPSLLKPTLKVSPNPSAGLTPFASPEHRNIWSTASDGADVMRVALGERTPQFGSIGELVLAESSTSTCSSEGNVGDFQGLQGAGAASAGIPLWTSFSGASQLFPVANDQTIAPTAGSAHLFKDFGAATDFGVESRYGIQRQEESVPIDLPSPMPPKPKVVPTITSADNDWHTVTKTCDKVVAKAISTVVNSFGGGAVEQGRIGNALSKEETLRTYIKDKHGSPPAHDILRAAADSVLAAAGSLINFFLSDEASRWFNVTAGVNGCYYVEVSRRQ